MTDLDPLDIHKEELKKLLTQGEFRQWESLGKAFLEDPFDPSDDVSGLRKTLHHAYCQASREVLINSTFPNLENWSHMGLQIADRSLPTAIEYFQSTSLFIQYQSAFNLRTWAAGSLQLLNMGEETEAAAAAFFKTTAALLGYMTFRELRAWTTAGLTLARNYPRLSYGFFSIVPEGLDFLYNTEWLKICKLGYSLARTHPKEIIALYGQTPSLLLQLSPSVRLKVLDAAKRRTENRPETVNAILTDLVETLQSYSHPTQETILNHEAVIAKTSVKAAVLYTNHLNQILKNMPETFLPQWTEKGISLLEEDEQRGIDYFAFNIPEAHRELEKWKNALVLDDFHQRLSLFTQAIAGAKLSIRSTEELDSDRDPVLRFYPTGDGEHIYLPPVAAGEFNSKGNFRNYKLAAAHQAGYVAYGTFDETLSGMLSYFESLPQKDLAEDIFFILEDSRIDQLLAQEYAGLKQDMDRVLAKVISRRPAPGALSIQDALVESILRLTTTGLDEGDIPRNLIEHIHAIKDILSGYFDKAQHIWDTFITWRMLYTYISNLTPPEPYTPRAPIDYRGRLDLNRLRGTDADDQQDGFSETIAENVPEEDPSSQSSQERSEPNRPLHQSAYVTFVETERVSDAPGRYISDLEDVRSPGGKHHSEVKNQIPSRTLISAASQKAGVDGPFYYDEWDYLVSNYRKKWCRLFEKDIEPADAGLVDDISKDYDRLIHKVRQQFQRIRPELLEMVRRVEWGDDIDFSAMIQGVVERKAGTSPTEKIFTRRERRIRQISLLLLLDMSASTNEWVPVASGTVQKEKKIIDIQVESLVVLMEALEALSDEYGIFGFSGSGKSQVDFYRIKNFSDTYSKELKRRIGGICPKQGTRMGPAIRHAIGKLRSIESDKRILLLLSDGYPQDFDYGEDRRSIAYGLHDTMMALLEAKKEGIRPFCITVDQSGNDYLRQMCDPSNYLVIKDIHALPEIMPKVVESLIA